MRSVDSCLPVVGFLEVGVDGEVQWSLGCPEAATNGERRGFVGLFPPRPPPHSSHEPGR
jgi:hypothetical protein